VTLKMQAAGFSETSALTSPPCVTANKVRLLHLTAPPGMMNRPVQRLRTQFQGISDRTCVPHAAVGWPATVQVSCTREAGHFPADRCMQCVVWRLDHTCHVQPIAALELTSLLWISKLQIRALRVSMFGGTSSDWEHDWLCV
jgi:hypothetical protein